MSEKDGHRAEHSGHPREEGQRQGDHNRLVQMKHLFMFFMAACPGFPGTDVSYII